MAQHNRIEVTIQGRTYQLSGGNLEHTRKVAKLVDETMSQLSAEMKAVDNFQLVILTSLHLADQLLITQQEFSNFSNDIDDSAQVILDQLENTLEQS